MPDARRNSSEKMVRQRWELLPDSARILLAAFAVHPEPLPAKWLAKLSGSARDVDDLVNASWIRETASSEWILADHMLREVVLRATPWALRQASHRSLAQLCRSDRTRLSLAAHHLESLGEDAARVAWMEAAAAHATAKEPARVHECLEAAQRLARDDTDPAHLDELVRVVERCATHAEVGAVLRKSIEGWLKEARRRRQHGFVARMAPLLASLLAAQGEHVAGAEWRVDAAHALRALGDDGRAAQQLVAATVTYAFALQYSAARETARLAVALAQSSGDRAVEVEALSQAGLFLGMKGDTLEGREHLERALDLALKHRLTSAAAEAYRMLGTVAEYASCYGDEQTAFAKALSYCRRHDETGTADLCLGCLSYSLFRSGNWARSRAVVDEVLGRKDPPVVSRFVAEGVLGLLLAHRGELRAATPLLERTITSARELGIYGMQFFGWWGLALVEEQNGQHAATALHYRRLLEFWKSTEDRHDAIPGLTCGGLFFADRGDTETAEEFGVALEHIARESANPEAVGAAALVAGELRRRAGDLRGAAKAFERSLAAFEKRDLVIERIRVLSRASRLHGDLGDQARASKFAEEAGKRARRLGARVMLMTLHNSTSAKQVETDAWGGLSPRQRDVAKHLSAGLTNKEIAARLGVSVRTVDMHVAHVLSRLDCRTRSEAASRIAVMLE